MLNDASNLTQFLSEAAETVSNGAVSPALFIAHREELLHQAQRTSESSPGPKGQSSKTAQFCVTLRESEMAETPSVSNAAQAGENTRKNSFLNYKSAALTN